MAGYPKQPYHRLESQNQRPRSCDELDRSNFSFKLTRDGFSRAAGTAMATADELFDKGRIKPLKLPPRLEVVQVGCRDRVSSARWAKLSKASPRFASERFNGRFANTGGTAVAAAEELFDGRTIRPLKLPPRLEVVEVACSARIPSARWRKVSKASSLFQSPRQQAKVDEFDPFERAIRETTSRANSNDDINSPSVNGVNRLKDFLYPRPAPSPASTSALRTWFPSEVKMVEPKFSSFRSTYDGSYSSLAEPVPVGKKLWGSFRIVEKRRLRLRDRFNPCLIFRRLLRKVFRS